MMFRTPGEVNCCVVCGRWPCTWGLCQVCRDLHCTQDPDTKKWTRPQWIRDLLAMHRREQRRRKDPRNREISLEEVFVPGLGYDPLVRGD